MIYLFPNNKGFNISTFTGWDIPEECIEVDDETYQKLLNHELQWSNGELVPYTKTAEDIAKEKAKAEKQALSQKRAKRTPLLKAFDIYKSNVAYGLIVDVEHNDIVAWYNDLLELEDRAFDNVPTAITRYLK